jgi:hypothetical protein
MLELPSPKEAAENTDAIRSYVATLFDENNFINPRWQPEKTGARQGDQNDLIEILLDLARYQYNDLTCRALQLINRLYSGAEELFLDAIHAEVVVEPESCTLAREMATKMPTIRRLCAGEIQEGEEEATFVALLDDLIATCKLDSRHVHEVRPDKRDMGDGLECFNDIGNIVGASGLILSFISLVFLLTSPPHSDYTSLAAGLCLLVS